MYMQCIGRPICSNVKKNRSRGFYFIFLLNSSYQNTSVSQILEKVNEKLPTILIFLDVFLNFSVQNSELWRGSSGKRLDQNPSFFQGFLVGSTSRFYQTLKSQVTAVWPPHNCSRKFEGALTWDILDTATHTPRNPPPHQSNFIDSYSNLCAIRIIIIIYGLNSTFTMFSCTASRTFFCWLGPFQ